MKKFFSTLFPKEFYKRPEYFRALVLAGLFVALAVFQLFTFEKFYSIIVNFDLPGGNPVAFCVAGIMPTLEVLALPYLLSMLLSVKLRFASKIALIAAPTLWLLISIWINIKGYVGIETGLMGATLSTMNGLWFVAFCVLWLWACVLVVRELPNRKKISV